MDSPLIHSPTHPSIFPSRPWVSLYIYIINIAIPSLPQVPPLASGGFHNIFQAPVFFPDLHWIIKCSLQLFPYFSFQNSQTSSTAPWLMYHMSLCYEILSLHNRSEVSDAQAFNGLAHSGYLKVA